MAIEPDRAAFELLRDNIYINCLEGVAFAHNVAASEAKGSLTLHRRITRSGNTSIAQPADVVLAQMGEPSSQAFQAVCVPIDQFLPEFRDRVDCIKIDVEGAEPLVLRGAQETLARNPQIKVVMEWSPGQMRDAGFDPREFTEMLNRLTLSAALIT